MHSLKRFALAIFVAGAGCGDPARESSEPGVLGDVDIASADLIESFKLGGVEAPAAEIFARAPKLEVRTNGTLYVLDSEASEVRVFDPQGRYVRSIGRQGNGPGEFVTPRRFGFVADTLWVIDWPRSHVSWFLDTGRHLRTEASGVSVASGDMQTPNALLANGRALIVEDVSSPEDAHIAVPILSIERDGDRADTLGFRPSTDRLQIPGVGRFALSSLPTAMLYDAVPGGESIVVLDWSVDQDGAGELRLKRFSADGSLHWERALTIALTAVSAAFEDSMVDAGMAMVRRTASQLQSVEPPRDLEAAVRQGLSLPRWFPPVDRLVAGADGVIWARVFDNAPERSWILFDHTGQPVLRAVLPSKVDVQAGLNSGVWGVMTDSLNVLEVVHYELQGWP